MSIHENELTGNRREMLQSGRAALVMNRRGRGAHWCARVGTADPQEIGALTGGEVLEVALILGADALSPCPVCRRLE